MDFKTIKDAIITFISFLFTECKPLFAFDASVQAFATLVPTWFFEHVSLDVKDEVMMRHLRKNDAMSLGSFLECVTKAFKGIVQSPWLEMSDSCLASDDPADLAGLGLDLGAQPLKLIGYFTIVGSVIVFAMQILLTVMYCSHRPGYFGGGKFVQFTLKLRAHPVYKVLAALLAGYSFVLVLATAYMGFRVYELKGVGSLTVFAQQFAGTVIGLTYTGVSYVMPDTKTDAKYMSPEYTTMTFKRSLKEITIDSLVFCKDVSHAALCGAATGERTEIDKYTGDGFTSANEIIEFVKKPATLEEAKQPLKAGS